MVSFMGNELIKERLFSLVLRFMFGSSRKLVGVGVGNVLAGLFKRDKLFLNDLVFFLALMTVAKIALLIQSI